jgi:tetratricopeptide (TPR) repeat protein
LAAAYNSSGKSEQGIAELDKAFRIEPGNMAVLKDLGLMSMQVNDYKKAQQMFRALLLQKFEGHTPISKAEVFFHLGEIHERLGEKPKALQMAERAVQTDANLQPAQVLLQRLKA